MSPTPAWWSLASLSSSSVSRRPPPPHPPHGLPAQHAAAGCRAVPARRGACRSGGRCCSGRCGFGHHRGRQHHAAGLSGRRRRRRSDHCCFRRRCHQRVPGTIVRAQRGPAGELMQHLGVRAPARIGITAPAAASGAVCPNCRPSSHSDGSAGARIRRRRVGLLPAARLRCCTRFTCRRCTRCMRLQLHLFHLLLHRGDGAAAAAHAHVAAIGAASPCCPAHGQVVDRRGDADVGGLAHAAERRRRSARGGRSRAARQCSSRHLARRARAAGATRCDSLPFGVVRSQLCAVCDRDRDIPSLRLLLLLRLLLGSSAERRHLCCQPCPAGWPRHPCCCCG
ncbi:hypothetical protein COO60DRAFT_135366 [Scenedesmus sp. NREL 46B-D3]|nr:hypothetical protein COO60DRAFT_135366 [Scenedesmus sp. NREL 46B-D3]